MTPGASSSGGEGFLHDPASRPVALVFGREEWGLQEEEVALCSLACALPTGRLQPSLNLSHAVALALSAFFDHRCGLRARQVSAAAGAEEGGRGGAASAALEAAPAASDNEDGCANAAESSGDEGGEGGAAVAAAAAVAARAAGFSRSGRAGWPLATADELNFLFNRITAAMEGAHGPPRPSSRISRGTFGGAA